MLALVTVLPKQDDVLDSLLVKVILRIFDSEIKCRKYYWVAKCFTKDEKELSTRLYRPSKCRLFATEPVILGLIEFIFELFETNGIRMTRASKAITLKEHTTIYASEMLRDLFRVILLRYISKTMLSYFLLMF